MLSYRKKSRENFYNIFKFLIKKFDYSIFFDFYYSILFSMDFCKERKILFFTSI